MGIFTTLEQHDYETLSSIEKDIGEVFPKYDDTLGVARVVIEFREYELYERILCFRERTTKQQIRAKVVREGFDIGGRCEKTIVERQSSWKKECGPSSGWEFQVNAVLGSLKQELMKKYGDVDTFESTVTDVIEGE